MSTPDTSPQLSKCHQAPVELSGGVGDFSDSDRVMTMHYVCTECKQPCDLYVADTSPGDEIEAILAVFASRVLASDMASGLTTAQKFADAKDRLNRLMLTRERKLLEKLKEKKFWMPENKFTHEFEGVNMAYIDEAIAAIDAQLNKEEK